MCFILRILHIKRLGTGCYVICSSLPLHCSAIPTTLLCHIVYCLLLVGFLTCICSEHCSLCSPLSLCYSYGGGGASGCSGAGVTVGSRSDNSALLRSGTSIGTAAQLLSLTSEKEKEPEIVNLHIKYF